MNATMIDEYLKEKTKIRDLLIEYVKSLSFEEAEDFFGQVLNTSTEDALIVGLEALEKEEGKYVTNLSDSIGCLLWADGNYSMLPILIEKMDNHSEMKNAYYNHITTLVVGCSQTRRNPLNSKDEKQVNIEVQRLIELFRAKPIQWTC